MNKQEAIERIESGAFTVEDTDLVVDLSYAKNIINQINEPQKPVIPKFVAEWIEDHKGDYSKWNEEAKADFVFRSINDLFRFGEGLNPWDFTIDEKFSGWTTENAYEFITAILFGYDVEMKGASSVVFRQDG